MIEKIQLTSLLFLAISWLFVSSAKAEDINDAIKAIVLTLLFGSAIIATVCTLIIIWA